MTRIQDKRDEIEQYLDEFIDIIPETFEEYKTDYNCSKIHLVMVSIQV